MLWVVGLGSVFFAALVVMPALSSPSSPTINVGFPMGDGWGEASPLGVSPRETTAALSVTSSSNTALVPSSYSDPTSGHCISASTTPVYLVTESATTTTGADGPYCTDSAACPAGAVIPIGGRIWARLASGGPVNLACRFRDVGAASGVAVPRGTSGVAPADVCLIAGGVDCVMDGTITVPRSNTAFANATPGLVISNATGAGGGGGVGKRAGTTTTEWSLYTDGLEMLRFSGTAAVPDSRVIFSPYGWQILADNGRSNRPGLGFSSCTTCGLSYAYDGTGGGGNKPEVRYSVDGVATAVARTDYTIHTTPQRMVKNTFGAVGFDGGLPGVGLYYDDVTDPSNPLLALQGATSAKSSLALVTPAGFGGDITLSSAGDVVATTLNASFTMTQTGDVVIAGNQLELPRLITAGATTLPACNGTHPSGMFWRDDTTDAVPGQACVCVSDSGAPPTSWSWVNLGGAACAP